MFILKKGHQPGVYVSLRALFLVCTLSNEYSGLVCAVDSVWRLAFVSLQV